MSALGKAGLNGLPRTSSPVSFAIAAGEPDNLALVLVSTTESGCRLSLDGREPSLERNEPWDPSEPRAAARARWIPLGFDPLMIAGLQAQRLLSARIDGSGHASTPTFLFPPLDAGMTFHAAAITLDGSRRIESVTSPIAIVTQ